MDDGLSHAVRPQSLAAVLRPLLPHSQDGGLIALVGAGGKTSALFGLADELAADGCDVLLSTTTHIVDPRREPGRPFDALRLDPRYAQAADAADPLLPQDFPAARPGQGRRVVLASREAAEANKLHGIHPSHVGVLRRHWPFVIVEADGARQKPLKAPAAHEPVLPDAADLILGLIGLDALGQPMNATRVHRPERFGLITGCALDEPIRLEHLAALAASPDGLFKGAPEQARRVLLLNKADCCNISPALMADHLRALAPGCADRILVCTLRASAPGERVRADVTGGRVRAMLSPLQENN